MAKISAPLVNMIKEGCEKQSALLIFHWIINIKIGEISSLNKCFSQINVGHNYWVIIQGDYEHYIFQPWLSVSQKYK